MWEIHAESLTVSTPIVLTVASGSATALNVETDVMPLSSRLLSQPNRRAGVIKASVARMLEIVLQKPGTYFHCWCHQSRATSDK
jgi:hypothetical protein